ncbi:MAG TPA: gamma-glutamyltransferase [Gemmatimonadales bacterium]|nr:gamma-glutamyltransferase [Gemmatimonadales bacterium]
MSTRGADPAPHDGTPAVITGQPTVPSTWALTGRAVPVTGPRAMVVTGHPLASAVGVDILKRGGNAVDAAVAVGFALAVVLPEAGNIGGGGFLVYRDTAGLVRALDYRETAPGRATRDMYLDSLGNVTDRSLTGHLAVGVPGSVAGLHRMWESYGRLPWATLVEPAVRLARDGHVVDSVRHVSIAEQVERLRKFPASAAQFLVHDTAPPIGAILRQPDLARTLQLIADSGPSVFYRGQIAELIVDEMERGGGLITRADLAGYQAKWRDPIRLTYRGYTVYSMPPASSGGITLGIILNIVEGYDTLPAFGTAGQVHLNAEAMRRAFVDRNRYLGDPDFVPLPLARLLSKSYAAGLRAQIDPRRATPTPVMAGSSPRGDHTTHYSIVDAEGNAAAVTTTLNGGFGSAVTVTGAGFLLNNEMDDFTAAPGQPNQYGLIQGEANAIAPGKRMLSAMTPSIVLDREGDLLMVVGTPGGPTIITTVYQVITNVLDHGMGLAEAVAAPRIHHQALPDVIRYEPGGLAASTVEALLAMGHRVEERRVYSGDVAAILRGPAGWIGVADPRRGGGAMGW